MKLSRSTGMAAGPPLWPVCQRPMVLADLTRVLALEVRCHSHPWTRGNFIDALAAGYLAELRLDSQGDLLGLCVAMRGVDETHLLNLAVAPEQQRQGHGLDILTGLAAQCRARGDAALWLEARESNRPALALYRRFGFTEISRRRAYYPAGHQREDAVVMSLALRADHAAQAAQAGPGHALD